MKSMTGFGRACADFKDFTLTIDISSLNKKGFEIFVGAPRDWQSLERDIACELKKIFSRGKFSVSITVEKASAASEIFAPDAAIKSALERLGELCAQSGAAFAPDAAAVLSLNTLLRENSSDGRGDALQFREQTLGLLRQACAELDKMREAEGAELKADLLARLQKIENLVFDAEAEAKNSPVNYKETLLQKLSALGLDLDTNDERVLREVCLFADKCDVSEEITRLKSHIKQFRELLDSLEPAGRKLDFLCQEIGREINTTASKANNLSLTKITLELKNELERIREQVQNLE